MSKHHVAVLKVVITHQSVTSARQVVAQLFQLVNSGPEVMSSRPRQAFPVGLGESVVGELSKRFANG